MNDVAYQLDLYADIPEPPYWLWSDRGDDGMEYCRQCALEQINYYGNGTSLDGGYCTEMDGCCHCATCGKLLDYTLTDYGARSEIAHFLRRRFKRPLDKETAYHVARMIAAAPDDKQAIRIANRAIQAIVKPPGGAA